MLASNSALLSETSLHNGPPLAAQASHLANLGADVAGGDVDYSLNINVKCASESRQLCCCSLPAESGESGGGVCRAAGLPGVMLLNGLTVS